ncbi:hypothetical protein [Mesobacillus foraminis]|uniref:Uncharacterized protein n=1 Tax=Mesobacillus foraminis TaxID=279826 RepID=A0A4R2BG40_9BACI|nr:hypothetical protein [Mesobacillus foraminis]TCN25473.1 hypothetical protein EV146_105130 [Mesobacillus foraminis]
MELRIITHSGNVYNAEVETFDAIQINDLLNDNQINTVAFGELILSRIDVKAVIPVVPTLEVLSEV